MPSWAPQEYLQFENERTRPSRDLVARISVDHARAVIDLGCGPGNSTAVLAERWPLAKITGLDNSAAMLERARQHFPQHEWISGDIGEWAASTDADYDIVFSNAALQWVAGHQTLYPRLLAHVRSGGVLAVQSPANMNAPAHKIMRDLAASPKWKDHFGHGNVREWHVHDAGFYYDVLSPAARNLDIWETEYMHVMPDTRAIAEWYKGTGLRPFLDALSGDECRDQFMQDYEAALREAYTVRTDGRVLFPFRRLFLIATN